MTAHRRVPVLLFAAVLPVAVLAGIAPWADAHLSIIRQGAESRGVIEPGDRHGEAVAAGDFNGDGYEDLAMGAPYEDLTGGFTDAGAVIVNWGTEFGVTHSGSLLLTESILGGFNEAGAEFGRALAAGDFNGDGYEDLAVGVPGHDGDAGKVLVLRGNSTTGLANWFTLYQTTGGGVAEAGDRFGEALAVGNFDADSGPAHDDLAVGTPGEDGFGGAVFFFMGSAGGLFGASGWFKQSSFGEANQGAFGQSLAAGNVIGDDADDLVVGAPFWDGAVVNMGRIYVLPGWTGDGFLGSGQEYEAWSVDAPQAGARFGAALAIGRFLPGNGWEAVAVGEPGRSVSGFAGAGRVVVFPGNGFGLDTSSEIQLTQSMAAGAPGTNDGFGSALAAGLFDTPDAYDDLAVGTPQDRFGATAYGRIEIFIGGPNGPGQHGFGAFDQATLGDPREGTEELGRSLAFGDFDGSGRGALAVGAPGEDGAAGQVHVIAPWRQTYGLTCRSSVALDCEGNMVFSQKPFETVLVASTTKIMTALIACERALLPPSHPDYVDLDQVHTVPTWILNEVNGPLEYTETITLRNLLYLCMLLSANDAAYVIGDILTGKIGIPGIPLFASWMNDRAAALGMTGTNFNNAAGREYEYFGTANPPNHYSTARDMALLGRAAMANPLVSEIVGTASIRITRKTVLPLREYDDDVDNILGWIVDIPEFPEGNGVKSGWTPQADYATVVSARAPLGGDAIATTFNAFDKFDARAHSKDLLKLGLAECNAFPDFIIQERFRMILSDASTALDAVRGALAGYSGPDETDVVVDFCRAADGPATSARMEVYRTSGFALDPGAEETLRIEPFQDHDEMRLYNAGTASITIEVTPDYGTTSMFTIPAGGHAVLPAHAGPLDGDGVAVCVRNVVGTGSTAFLEVEEAYGFDVAFPPGPCIGPVFTATLPRSSQIEGDVYAVRVIGTDPVNDESVGVIVRDAGTTVGIHDVEWTAPRPGAGEILNLRAAPNPMAGAGGRPGIHFELRSAGRIGASLFDAAGRLVRRLPEAEFGAGPVFLPWDGRNERGSAVPRGVYFYRVDLRGAGSASGRWILVR